MTRTLSVCAGLALCALLVAGCAALGIYPPFDATGTYRGTWEGTLQGAVAGERTCSVTFDLAQDDKYQLLQGFVLTGRATVYFSCESMLDDIAENGLPSEVDLDVGGFLLADGRIAFASIEPGATQSVLIMVNGVGLDKDEDGAMDQITGGWSLVIDQPGHPRITINGTVDAAAA